MDSNFANHDVENIKSKTDETNQEGGKKKKKKHSKKKKSKRRKYRY